MTPEDAVQLMESAICEAHQRLVETSEGNWALEGMGTTVVAALAMGNRVVIGNVGDSRGYLVRPDVIEQITVDDSLVWQLIAAGEITKEEGRRHHLRNVVTQALGLGLTVRPHISVPSLEGGEIYLLCTDGLTDALSEQRILQVVLDHSGDLNMAAQSLVDEANKAGGYDNITVVLFTLW